MRRAYALARGGMGVIGGCAHVIIGYLTFFPDSVARPISFCCYECSLSLNFGPSSQTTAP